MPGVGDKLGRYTLLKRLAIGGMGEVFVAAKPGPMGFGPFVALKVLRDDLAGDQQFVDMLVDEANITKHLNHQNLVSVLDLGEDAGSYYIAMEFVRGITAERLIESLVERRRKLDIPLAIHIGVELCKALKYAHSRTNEKGEPLNIIHRDVTPANILISTEGEVKLTDFGIARAIGRNHQTQAGVLKGKFGYMAPEMVRYETLDGRVDLFCVGVALYLFIAGQHPVAQASVIDAIHRYENKAVQPLSELNSEVTPELEAIVMKAMEPQPKERWQSAAEFGDALQSIVLQHTTWRTSARDASSGLARRLREVAPEVFGEVVSADVMHRCASPVAQRTEWFEEAQSDESTPSKSALVTGSPSVVGRQESSGRAGRIEEPFLPAKEGERDFLDSDERTMAGYGWDELDQTIAAEVSDLDDATVVGSSSSVSEGHDPKQASSADSLPEATIVRDVSPPPGDRVIVGYDSPTIIPDAQRVEVASDESDEWGEPGETLLEGVHTNDFGKEVFGAIEQTVAEGTLHSVSSSEMPSVPVSPAKERNLPHGFMVESASNGSIRSSASDSAALGPVSVAVSGHSAHRESVAVPISGGIGMGSDTGKWIAGQLDARKLEWGDDAAGRRAVVTRNQPQAQTPQPPLQSMWDRPGPVLVLAGVLCVFAGLFAYVWFFSTLFWPELQISTSPSGAQISIDGRLQAGMTPIVVRMAPGQRHRIELRAKGYRTALREITDGVVRAQSYTLEVALERIAPTLYISPVDGRVFVNNAEIGRGREVQLVRMPDVGAVRIRVEAPGYEPYVVSFESAAQMPVSLDIPLETAK